MAYVPTRTDQTKYSAVDGVDPVFGTVVELSAGGFGVQRIDPRSGKVFFEVLDALPAGKQAIQLAVEAGSTATAGMVGPAAAGFVAIDMAAQDNLDAGEIAADATDGLTPDLEGPGDLT